MKLNILKKPSQIHASFIVIVTLILTISNSSFAQMSLDSLDITKKTKINVSEINFSVQSNQIFLSSGTASGEDFININGTTTSLEFNNGLAKLDIETDRKGRIYFFKSSNQLKLVHFSRHKNGNIRIKNIPLWLSIMPPIVAIILALIFKEVVVSLFMGIWSGAFIVGGLRWDSPYMFVQSFFDTVQKYILDALADADHLSVMLFSLLIGGMVAVISKNGGMAGVVKLFSKFANSAKNSQLVTWILGVLIFFDDYANTLIVGNTMRSVTDKFKVSREKLAYIVDSTAAPIAAVAFITTWIGAELGYIGDSVATIDLGIDSTPYSLFLKSLKYSFYPILTLLFMIMLILSGKDYGPMLKAERRARSTGQVSSARTSDEDEPDMEDLTPVKAAPQLWWHAAVPVLTVLLMTIFGLLVTGFEGLEEVKNGIVPSWSDTWKAMDGNFFTKLGNVIGASNSYIALMWASLMGVIVAIIITVSSRIMKLFDTIHWLTTGFKTMMPAMIILTLAWALAITTKELHTADYLSTLLSGNISPYLMTGFIFILSAFISFSTGSSWSTMAILYPIAVPTGFAVCQAAGMSGPETVEIVLCIIANVLGASVLGDHCSPISDTTILSSLSSDCNHLDHVRTQMPYALTVGGMSFFSIIVSSYLGGGLLLSIGLIIFSCFVFYLIIYRLGKFSE